MLYTPAVDILALKFYADKDYAYALGKLIAKGKESDVYEVLSSKSDLYALKLFRLGRTSFREVTRKRAAGGTNTWLEINYRAAEREFHALSRLAGVSANVPAAITYNRHTVLLEELPGVRLSTRPELSDPRDALSLIMVTIRDVYIKAGMINSDLSEYNILTDGRRVWLIDWPQWVGREHPNALELLKRDIGATVRFFRRAYGLEVEPEAVLDYVTGKRKEPSVRRG